MFSKSNSIIFKIIDLYYQIHSIKIKTFRIKLFLNENFDSNKKIYIEKFKKDNSL